MIPAEVKLVDVGPCIKPLVERLRVVGADYTLMLGGGELYDEAADEIVRLRDTMRRLVSGIDHLDALARLWEPDYSSGSDRRGWMMAKDARDAAMSLLRDAP